MNRGSLLFLGAFLVLAFSWTGLVLTNHVTTARLGPHYDEVEAAAFPLATPGLAARGHRVYQEMGCASCHTQQVRRPGFGGDIARGWGERQSVARDYLRDQPVLLGDQRIGPDLRNVGARRDDAGWHYLHLYNPRLTVEGSLMPAYPFLFEERRIVGQPSPEALMLPAPLRPPAGYEIVPSERARSLVAYLTSLNDTYAFPETNNIYQPAEGETDAEAAPEAAPEESP